jgi:hypothetical protein
MYSSTIAIPVAIEHYKNEKTNGRRRAGQILTRPPTFATDRSAAVCRVPTAGGRKALAPWAISSDPILRSGRGWSGTRSRSFRGRDARKYRGLGNSSSVLRLGGEVRRSHRAGATEVRRPLVDAISGHSMRWGTAARRRLCLRRMEEQRERHRRANGGEHRHEKQAVEIRQLRDRVGEFCLE